MTINKLFILFVFFFGLTAFSRPQIIDFHFHLQQGRSGEVHRYLESENGSFFDRRMSFFISDGYLKLPDLKNGIDFVQHEVSDFVRTLPDSGMGYCGIDPTRDSYLSEIRNCLKLPKMVGVKLRIEDDNSYLAACQNSQNSFSKKFTEIAREVESKSGLLLTHFTKNNSYYYGELPELDWGPCAERESQALIEIARKFPKVKFIIAHSGIRTPIGIRGLEYIGDWYSRHPEVKRNIYTEISSVPYIFFGSGLCHRYEPPYSTSDCAGSIEWWAKTSPTARRISKAWKKFDTNFVLYGSDFVNSNFATDQYAISPLESIQFILLNPEFTEKEKQKILFKNGEKLTSP